MALKELSLFSVLSLMMINAYAMGPITDDDIAKVNKILTSPMSQDKVIKMLRDNKEIARRYKSNQAETSAFISAEVIKDRCENIDRQFLKSFSGIANANKNIGVELNNLLNSRAENFSTSLSQDRNLEEFYKRKELYKNALDNENKLKKEVASRESGSLKIKVDEMKNKWTVALQGISKNKKGVFQADKDLFRENCNKFILPFHKELSSRAKGTYFQKEAFDLWDSTFKKCKAGQYASSNMALRQTNDYLSAMNNYFSPYSISSLKEQLSEISRVKNAVDEKVRQAEEQVKMAQNSAKDIPAQKLNEEVCTPFLTSVGMISDSIRDSNYTEALNISELLDSSISKFKITCAMDPIKKEIFIADYKQLSEALIDAQGFVIQLEKAAKIEKDACARSVEVYAILRKKELAAYSALLAAEEVLEGTENKEVPPLPTPDESAPVGNSASK